MAIEFRCPGCGKLLRTTDDTAGKQAQCPACNQLSTIPAASVTGSTPDSAAATLPGGGLPPFSPDLLAGYGLSPATAAANPYQSPLAAALDEGDMAGGRAGHVLINLGDVYSRTWRIFQGSVLKCFGLVAVSHGISLAVGFVGGLVLAWAHIPQVTGLIGVGAVGLLLNVFLTAGQVGFFLKVARGRPASLGDLFRGGRWYFPLLGATLLFWLAFGLGYVLCIIPGVIVGLMLSQYSYLVVDRNLGSFEALGESKRVTTGNKGTIFAIYLLSMIVPIVVTLSIALGMQSNQQLAQLLLQGVSVLWLPWFLLLAAVTYLSMTGQPTVADEPSLPIPLAEPRAPLQ